MLKKSFYTRDAIIVAKELLGKKICHNNKEAIIVETEAYTINDPGSHAHKGRTKRNK
jgi:DNA-3-methyladenine glycosylase